MSINNTQELPFSWLQDAHSLLALQLEAIEHVIDRFVKFHCNNLDAIEYVLSKSEWRRLCAHTALFPQCDVIFEYFCDEHDEIDVLEV